MKKLTKREMEFVNLLVSGKSISEAYKTAYKSESENKNSLSSTGSSILRRPHIRAYYDKRIEDTKIKIELNAELIISNLIDIAVGNPQKIESKNKRRQTKKTIVDGEEKNVRVEEETEDEGTYIPSLRERQEALKTLGKYIGLEKQTINIVQKDELSSFTNEELMELIDVEKE